MTTQPTPTADDLVLMSVAIVLGRRMQDTGIEHINEDNFRAAWHSIKNDIRRAEERGQTVLFPE